jgi:exodeoxyribonuclease VII large subunit
MAFLNNVYGNYQLIIQNAKSLLIANSSMLKELKYQIRYGVTESLSEAKTIIRAAKANLNQLGLSHLMVAKQNLSNQKSIIKNEASAVVIRKNHQLSIYKKSVALANPEHILKRGFSITRINGKLIRENMAVKEGDEIETTTNKLIIQSTITNAIEKNG